MSNDFIENLSRSGLAATVSSVADDDTAEPPEFDLGKQSELPFVFFLRPAASGYMPHLLNPSHAQIELRSATEDVPGAALMSVQDVLGFYHTDFSHFPTAISLSKATWTKGKKLELMGESSYREIVLPMLKAVDHFTALSVPRLHSHLVFPFAVVRAPMVGGSMSERALRVCSP